LEVHPSVRDYLTKLQAAEAHIHFTIDRILELAPRLAGRLLRFAGRPGQFTGPAEFRTWGPACSIKLMTCANCGRCYR
jgi:hypothetical protein